MPQCLNSQGSGLLCIPGLVGHTSVLKQPGRGSAKIPDRFLQRSQFAQPLKSTVEVTFSMSKPHQMFQSPLCVLREGWRTIIVMDTPPRTPYPTDVSDDEWAFLAPSLTLMREDAPQRRTGSKAHITVDTLPVAGIASHPGQSAGS